MIDAADKAVMDDERAMEVFQQTRPRHQAPDGAWARRSGDINCVDCAEIIPQERLAAMPHTKRCVRCAADVERR